MASNKTSQAMQYKINTDRPLTAKVPKIVDPKCCPCVHPSHLELQDERKTNPWWDFPENRIISVYYNRDLKSPTKNWAEAFSFKLVHFIYICTEASNRSFWQASNLISAAVTGFELADDFVCGVVLWLTLMLSCIYNPLNRKVIKQFGNAELNETRAR